MGSWDFGGRVLAAETHIGGQAEPHWRDGTAIVDRQVWVGLGKCWDFMVCVEAVVEGCEFYIYPYLSARCFATSNYLHIFWTRWPLSI